ncbi:BTAD domain-containing putative transcriptional regulator [Actinocrispum sp. NPDC049592]|uniref:AfsR/SARP family transcriptional regulator n=1 Tax=Actinocrispum sp. NPDC049592 TaxID=3154835 RepID=UPI00343E8500
MRVSWRGAEVPLGTPQAKSVFAVLLLARGEPVTRDRIASELWADTPPATAKVKIQGLVSQLRRALPEPLIRTEGSGYVLRAPGAVLDVDVFAGQVAEARRLVDEGWAEAGAGKLADALALWRGPALADVPVPAARQAAGQWEEQRLAAIGDRMAADLELRRCDAVAAELPDLIAANPFREQLRSHLMTALARCGRIPEALRAYRDWYEVLRDELGVPPSPEMRALHCGILRAEPGLRPSSYSTWRRPGVPAQLPPVPADFVGRQAEQTELTRRLASFPVQVVTASGGVGKSLLAIRVAHRVKGDYPDGTILVRLRATGTEPMTTLAALSHCLQALDVPADMLPAGVGECAELFQDMMSSRRVLLVLDDAVDRRQVSRLLPRQSRSAVIITARRPIDGLPNYPLGPMSTEDIQELFARKGCAASNDVLELCQGIPLAAVIVAGRLADRPDADPARSLAQEYTEDGAVRAAFLFAHGLLGPRHETLFRRLGLLAGVDFGSWVAEVLLDGPADGLLDDLARCHMVQRVAPGRYRLHDLLRSFAQEKALPSERDPGATRLLGAWLWLAEQAAAKLPGSLLRPAPGDAPRYPVPVEIGDPYAWFEREHVGLSAAVDLAAELGMGAMAWEIAVVTAGYFDHRGLRGDWFRCYQRALPAARAAGEDRGVAALLRGIGQLWIYWDDLDRAMAVLTESRSISERIGDLPGVARAIAATAAVHRERNQYEQGLVVGRQALDLLTRAGDRQGAIQARCGLAICCLNLDRPGEAESWLDAALRDCGTLGDGHRMASVLQAQAQLHLKRDDVPSALRCLTKAMEMLSTIRDERCTANARLLLGQAYASLGDHEAARNTLINASIQYVHTGNGAGEAKCARLLGTLTAR